MFLLCSSLLAFSFCFVVFVVSPVSSDRTSFCMLGYTLLAVPLVLGASGGFCFASCFEFGFGRFGFNLYVCGFSTVCSKPRYDIAKMLNMDWKDPIEGGILELVCSELESDDAWDSSIPLHRGYIKAGLKRFRIEKDLMARYSSTETNVEQITSSCEKAEKASALERKEAACAIKIEHPQYVALTEALRVCKSAESKVCGMLSLLKKDKARLVAKKTPECPALRTNPGALILHRAQARSSLQRDWFQERALPRFYWGFKAGGKRTDKRVATTCG